jgi:GAF domain-containing protein
MQSSDQRHTVITSYRLDDLFRYCRELFTALPNSGHGDLCAVFSELLSCLEQNLHFDYLSFALHDPTRDSVTVVFEAGEFKLPREVPIMDASLGVLLHEQHAIEVEDVQAEKQFPDLVALAEKGGFRSFRIVPLSTDRNRLGTFGVARRQPGPFSAADVCDLDHTAKLFALVLENALMANVLTREKTRMEMLLDVNTALISSLDMHKLFRDVSGLIQRVVRQDLTHLALYDKVHDMMDFYVVDSGDGAAVPSADGSSECWASRVSATTCLQKMTLCF